MAFKPGYGAYIAIDNVAGTPVNVSTYADNISFNNTTATNETSTFGDAASDHITGLTSAGVELSGPADVALGTFIAALWNAQSAGSATSWTVQYGPGGSVAGQVKESAEAFVTAYNVSTGVGGRAEYSASLQVTGATTFSTW
jgi:hypothetical protein